jgi:hypothetical protein
MDRKGWELKLSEGRWQWFEVWLQGKPQAAGPRVRYVVYERGMGFALETAQERYREEYAAAVGQAEVTGPIAAVIDGRERLRG